MQSRVRVMQQVIFSLITAAIFNNIGFHNKDGLNEKVTEKRDSFSGQRQLFYAGMQVYGTIFFLSMNNFMGSFFNSILVF